MNGERVTRLIIGIVSLFVGAGAYALAAGMWAGSLRSDIAHLQGDFSRHAAVGNEFHHNIEQKQEIARRVYQNEMLPRLVAIEAQLKSLQEEVSYLRKDIQNEQRKK